MRSARSFVTGATRMLFEPTNSFAPFRLTCRSSLRLQPVQVIAPLERIAAVVVEIETAAPGDQDPLALPGGIAAECGVWLQIDLVTAIRNGEGASPLSSLGEEARDGDDREGCPAAVESIDFSGDSEEDPRLVNLRRILSATLTAIWLLPVALAGGVALHVAFDHDFGQGEIAHAATLPEALEHGHAHAGESTDHEHRLVTAPSIAVRVGAASVPPSELVAGVGSGLGAPGALAGGVASPPARPPRASGTALLALLAIFRI